MVESTSNIPFDVSQLVNAGTATTVTVGSQQVGSGAAILSDTSTFTLTTTSERREKWPHSDKVLDNEILWLSAVRQASWQSWWNGA